MNLHKMARSIRLNCIIWKKLEKKLVIQKMGNLPERLKPVPKWYCTGIDFLGPFTRRGEVQKRSRGKAYGILFNYLGTRTVHVDLADISTPMEGPSWLVLARS